MDHPQDHFSAMASDYRHGRITYPGKLYKFLENLCLEKNLAWDCATGTGQAANDLSPLFKRVIATDISKSLLSLAGNIQNVEFRCVPAEASGIETDSLDLITVAQAIHWFDLESFWQEAVRVLKPNGILAYWGYLWPEVDPTIDALLTDFRKTIENFWPVRSRYLHQGYVDIEAPLECVDTPDFWIQEHWSASQYLAHLASWSGTRYCGESTGTDPLLEFSPNLKKRWGSSTRTVKWPLILNVYRNVSI